MSGLPPREDWQTFNRRKLCERMERLRLILRRYMANTQAAGTREDEPEDMPPVSEPPGAPLTALDRVSAIFELSPFEADLLLLCASVELDSDFEALCEAAQARQNRTLPTFGFAFAALPGPHWSALSPDRPLRRWRLLEIGPGTSLTTSPLRIDEQILNFLAGVPHSDERLSGVLEPIESDEDLVDSHLEAARRMARVWTETADLRPAIQLCGSDPGIKRAIASHAARLCGLSLNLVASQMLPVAPADLDRTIRQVERECLLSGGAVLLECEGLESAEPAREHAIGRFIETPNVLLAISTPQRRRPLLRPLVSIDIARPLATEQRGAWLSALGPGMGGSGMGGSGLESPGMDRPATDLIDNLVAQFNLQAHDIRGIAATALVEATANTPDEIYRAVWNNCRMQSRPRLEDLAQRLETNADWDDLVLPEAQRRVLRDIVAHVRQRATVYHRWGFGGENKRGLGISALFAGGSGTGKTMASEVLARELRLDLYRIDLSSVVSKYIGETEKNLRRLFDAAEESGAILLFDEADALFGKRSEVKDSHDRHANIEVSYLLQRVESYKGLAILTSNLQEALDTAFLRRLRFIVQFPFPDAAMRAEIWRRVFPPKTPTEGLDSQKLARLNVSGGNIRNIALNAAFAAAEAGEPVRPVHIVRAARSEYEKLERPLPESEVRGLL